MALSIPKLRPNLQLPDKYGWLMFGSMGLHLVGALALLLCLGAIGKLASQERTFVQVDDATVPVEEMPAWHREDELVRSFVGATLTMLFTFGNEVAIGQHDKGYRLDNDQILPTTTYLATHFLDRSFRDDFQKLLAESYIPDKLFRQGLKYSIQGQILIRSVEVVDYPGDGVWRVAVRSDRTIVVDGQEQYAAPFDRIIRVKATDRPELPLEDETPNPLAIVLAELGHHGLIITDIEEFN